MRLDVADQCRVHPPSEPARLHVLRHLQPERPGTGVDDLVRGDRPTEDQLAAQLRSRDTYGVRRRVKDHDLGLGSARKGRAQRRFELLGELARRSTRRGGCAVCAVRAPFQTREVTADPADHSP